jgi:hypothetical protein
LMLTKKTKQHESCLGYGFMWFLRGLDTMG